MNHARLTTCVVFAGIALIAGASLTSATTVQKFTLQQLTNRSSTIVLATVDDVTSSWDAGHKEIYTFVTLRVQDPIKGVKAESKAKGPKIETTITIRQIGGTVDHISSIVPGMPSFARGEQVVVFLGPNDGAGYPGVVGLQQGKYTVTTDANGFKQVRNDVDGLTRLSPDGSKTDVSVSDKMPLDAFLTKIRTDLGDAGKIQITPTE
jgi:hypothetical protein